MVQIQAHSRPLVDPFIEHVRAPPGTLARYFVSDPRTLSITLRTDRSMADRLSHSRLEGSADGRHDARSGEALSDRHFDARHRSCRRVRGAFPAVMGSVATWPILRDELAVQPVGR
jgi:hypothetical protein